MIVIATLIIFFGLFWIVKKHPGPAILAVIAGISVYTLFNPLLISVIHNFFPDAPDDIIRECLYLSFVVFFPIILYLRSERRRITGLIRIIEAGVLSILIATLLSGTLASHFSFDVIARDIADFIAGIEGIIVIIAVIVAYLDILLYRKHDE